MRLGLEDSGFADTTRAFRRGGENVTISNAVADAVECARAQMTRDIHDISGHHIVSALFQLASIEKKLAGKALSRQFEDLRNTICQLSEELHTVASGGAQDGFGGGTLVAALSELIGRWERHVAIPVQFRFSLARDLDGHDNAAQTAFCVVREALTNIAKHAAGASRVTIDLNLSDMLVVIVEDDGEGCDFAVAQRRPSTDAFLGLKGMVERVEKCGGTLAITRGAEGGVCLAATLPVEDMVDAGVGKARR